MSRDGRSLLEKLNDSTYLQNLSSKRYRQLMICRELLSDEELGRYSSIEVAYNIARSRFVSEVLDRVNPDIACKVKSGKYPIFWNIYLGDDRVGS